jgi:SAM-dependent methyltransferase
MTPPTAPPQTLDLRAVAEGITRGPDGVWRTQHTRDVSYPEAHDLCAELEDTSYWFAHRNRCITAVMTRVAPAATPFVEIGAGNGVVAAAVAALGHEVVVVEPGERGIANAGRRGLPHRVCGTLEDARFRAGTFAAAGMFDVIEHVQDDVALLREVRRILAPGGVVVTTVPARRWLWSREDEDAGHFRRYDEASLTRALDAAGYDVVRLTGMFRPLVLPILLFRALPTRLGLARPPDADRARRQHGTQRGLVTRWIESRLRSEAAALAAGRTLRGGSSLLVVARART